MAAAGVAILLVVVVRQLLLHKERQVDSLRLRRPGSVGFTNEPILIGISCVPKVRPWLGKLIERLRSRAIRLFASIPRPAELTT